MQKTTQCKGRRKRRCLSLRGKILILLFATILIGGLHSTMSKATPANPPLITQEELLLEYQNYTNTTTADRPWYLTLVNKWNPIPTNYNVRLVEIEGGEQIDERIYEPLVEMLEAAKESNWDQLPLVVSGYRTIEQQQHLYKDKITQYLKQGYSQNEAQELTKQWVALPGYSEHQLGFAVDINGATYDLYLWLQENSYKYGFIFRYPGNKTEITGTAEEV